MTSIRRSESGFSLVEVMVALTIITTGIIGTISMVSANRAIMESSWAQARMGMIADGVMNELAVQFQRDGVLPVTASYDFDADPDALGLAVLFNDNGYNPSASTLALSAGASPISYIATLTVLSPSGRRMTRSRNFYKKLKTP
ncbi:MAG: prepilin-type N-terminal cleavage/methylation domain-containing protein [Alphaproteobacteria bacterium]|nr:prepilin-type N-terminal cleavage/methylation domain-containing protein [Alphaproteobacteria bacterium]